MIKFLILAYKLDYEGFNKGCFNEKCAPLSSK